MSTIKCIGSKVMLLDKREQDI